MGCRHIGSRTAMLAYQAGEPLRGPVRLGIFSGIYFARDPSCCLCEPRSLQLI